MDWSTIIKIYHQIQIRFKGSRASNTSSQAWLSSWEEEIKPWIASWKQHQAAKWLIHKLLEQCKFIICLSNHFRMIRLYFLRCMAKITTQNDPDRNICTINQAIHYSIILSTSWSSTMILDILSFLSKTVKIKMSRYVMEWITF